MGKFYIIASVTLFCNNTAFVAESVTMPHNKLTTVYIYKIYFQSNTET